MLDWELYKNHFSAPQMRKIWSETNTISTWLKTEQSLANCQAALDIIPQDSAASISRLSLKDIDLERLAADMALVGRPIVGLIKQMRELVGAEHASHVHFGTTTQDILDTTLVVQMKQSLALIDKDINAICARLDQLFDQNATTMMIGRTNNQHALPIRLSSKFQLWCEELNRRRTHLAGAGKHGLWVQIGGPLGDLSTYGDKGELLKQAWADYYGIGYVQPHWQNARDGVAEIISALGLLSSSLLKIAQNISLLSSSDISELSEIPEKGKGASSSMAHKRNQRCCEFAEAVARLARQRAEQINETSVHQHERSGNVWISEWMIVPDVFLLNSGALLWTQKLFNNLNVDIKQIDENLKSANLF